MSDVKILAKSRNTLTGDTITTFELSRFPKLLLAELNTHRLLSLLSKSAESSRARSTNSVIKQVIDDPYIPTWTRNQKGMSGEACYSAYEIEALNNRQLNLRDNVVEFVRGLSSAFDPHKQNINRYLEPWMRVSVIITATEWDNFFKLRTHHTCQDDFRSYAIEMERLYHTTPSKNLTFGDWHLPYEKFSVQANTAKVAGISYANHNKDKTESELLNLHDRLWTDRHLVPFEHCATPVVPGEKVGENPKNNNILRVVNVFNFSEKPYRSSYMEGSDYVDTGNFSGFLSYRRIKEFDLAHYIGLGKPY